MQPIYTKKLLILKFKEIRDLGWVLGAREGNHGTKFRFKNGKLPELYAHVEII